MKRLYSWFGTTFIFVTHDQSEALSPCPRGLRSSITRGIASDRGYARRRSTSVPRVASSSPSSSARSTFLPVEDVGHRHIGTRRAVRRRLLNRPASGSRPGSGVLAVRPEHMFSRDRCPAGANGVTASVAATTYLGGSMRLGLVTRGGTRLDGNAAEAEDAARMPANGPTLGSRQPAPGIFLLPEEGAEAARSGNPGV